MLQQAGKAAALESLRALSSRQRGKKTVAERQPALPVPWRELNWAVLVPVVQPSSGGELEMVPVPLSTSHGSQALGCTRLHAPPAPDSSGCPRRQRGPLPDPTIRLLFPGARRPLGFVRRSPERLQLQLQQGGRFMGL